MSEIYIDPNKVDENANEIERLGKAMKVKMEEVNAKVTSLRADWQDDSQADYDAEFKKLTESFNSLTESIPRYVSNAHTHAEEMRRIGKS